MTPKHGFDMRENRHGRAVGQEAPGEARHDAAVQRASADHFGEKRESAARLKEPTLALALDHVKRPDSLKVRQR